MSVYCHNYRAHSSVDEPNAVHECDYCHEAIFIGEEMVEIGDSYYHMSCIEDEMTARELLSILGYYTREATIDG